MLNININVLSTLGRLLKASNLPKDNYAARSTIFTLSVANKYICCLLGLALLVCQKAPKITSNKMIANA